MKKEEDIISYEEFGGWPIYKMNVGEILMELGGKVEGDKITFDLNSPILSVYPVTVHEDGMGYGIDEEYITEVSTDNKNFVTMFRNGAQ